MFPVHPRLVDIQRGVRTAKRLEKIAAHYADDPEVIEKLANAKVRVEAEVFGLIKQAAGGMVRRFFSSAPGKAFGKSLGIGAGLAVPTALTGAYLLGKGREEAERTAEAVRNKVLQGALGVAGIGLGSYGLGRALGAPANPMEWLQQPTAAAGKTASAKDANDKERLAEAVEKLATVGALESMLDLLPDTLDAETTKLAAEIRVLNRSYGIHILHELYPDG